MTARVAAADLEQLILTATERCGVPERDRALVAEALLQADLRGIPTHGSYRLPAYSRALASGELNPTPDVRRVSGRGAVELLDADNGLGLVAGQLAMDRAIELAREHGVGVVGVRRSNHAGMLAVHAMRAAAAGMIGFFVCNAPGLMAPFGGRDPLLSNGPLAWAIPRKGEPLVADMACSVAARGKIRMRAEAGEALPEGWAVDAEGRPTTDADAAMHGVILPMAEHKGYALAVINEILSSSLTGAVLSMNISKAFLQPGARAYDSWGTGHLALALDPTAFVPIEEFERSVDELTEALEGSRPAVGSDGVLIPGDPELARSELGLREGIELGDGVIAALDEFCAEFELEPLRRREGKR